MNPKPTCLIAGSGLAGLLLALRLKQELGDRLDVILCTRKEAYGGDPRAYTIAPATQDILIKAGLWDDLARYAQPVMSMLIGDSALEDPARPVFLTFEPDHEKLLAHILEGGFLEEALYQACLDQGVTFIKANLTRYEHHESALYGVTDQAETIPASLLIAADGARSFLRDQARIGWTQVDYAQKAVTAILSQAEDHRGMAIQHFLESGPFALLPLPAKNGFNRVSLVWSCSNQQADELMAMDESSFLEAVQQGGGAEMGPFRLETKPTSFPLWLGLARSWVKPRFALLGDSAHKIHPLAGQGLNLGFQDAECLCQEISFSVRLGLDPASSEGLKRYERKRRPEAVAMASVTTGLNMLFARQNPFLRMIRQTGLGLTQRSRWMRSTLMRKASGAGA